MVMALVCLEVMRKAISSPMLKAQNILIISYSQLTQVCKVLYFFLLLKDFYLSNVNSQVCGFDLPLKRFQPTPL